MSGSVCVEMMEEPSLKPNLWSAGDKSKPPLSFLWIIPIVLSIFLSPTDEPGSKRLLPCASPLWHILLINTLSYIWTTLKLFSRRELSKFCAILNYICACSPLITCPTNKKRFNNSTVPLKTVMAWLPPPDINPPVEPPSLPTLIWYIILEQATTLLK